MRAWHIGRLMGFALVAIIVIGGWAVDTVRNWLFFEKVDAVVERIDAQCYLHDESVQAATDCLVAKVRGAALHQTVMHATRVQVSYRSPADGQQHTGLIVTSQTESEVRAHSRWEILAHKQNAAEIKEN